MGEAKRHDFHPFEKFPCLPAHGGDALKCFKRNPIFVLLGGLTFQHSA